MDLYADNILDHYRDPRGKGDKTNATVTHEEVNHSCGDALEVQLLIDDDRIQKIAWNGDGCAISQAAMSILSEEYTGKTIGEIDDLRKDDVYELLGVPIGPRRFKCALLGLHTLKNTIRKYRGEAPQSWVETVAVDEK